VTNTQFFFLSLHRHFLQSVCILFLTCLAGCGNDDFSDLNQYIAKIKAAPKGKIKPLPEVKEIEAFIFNPSGLRDPFKPIVQTEQQNAVPELSPGGGITPDSARRKEEMEDFALETMKMVGTLKMKSTLWGLVRTDDGTVHRVRLGNYMGKNYGKITRISVDKIELMEIVPDKPGRWREQKTSLAFTE